VKPLPDLLREFPPHGATVVAMPADAQVRVITQHRTRPHRVTDLP